MCHINFAAFNASWSIFQTYCWKKLLHIRSSCESLSYRSKWWSSLWRSFKYSEDFSSVQYNEEYRFDIKQPSIITARLACLKFAVQLPTKAARGTYLTKFFYQTKVTRQNISQKPSVKVKRTAKLCKRQMPKSLPYKYFNRFKLCRG